MLKRLFCTIRKRTIKRAHIKLYKRIANNNAQHYSINKEIEGEKLWKEKWSVLDSQISPLSYRIFSEYVGCDVNILPCEVCASQIEPVLNPIEYRAIYSDKNAFDHLFGQENTCGTILRRIDGQYYTKEYYPISLDDKMLNTILNKEEDRIIIKPSVDSDSGKGVQMIRRRGNNWYTRENTPVTIDYLKNLGKDLIIQPYFEQSDFMKQFNPTSVNTLRIFAYRSVKDGNIYIPNAIIRIGGEGSIIDNAHGGGRFVGLTEGGKTMSIPCDFLGKRNNIHNGIDFSKQTFIIPNYDKVLEFVKTQSLAITQHHILAWDICLDKNNNPKILEINVYGFGSWVFQFSSGTTFGEFTDEIIEYVKSKKPKYVGYIK